MDPDGESAVAAVSTAFGVDLSIPEPTDAAPVKWLGWVVAFVGAFLIDKLPDTFQQATSDGTDFTTNSTDNSFGLTSPGMPDPNDPEEDNSKARQPASEQRAKSMAKQIEKDLGKDARRDFHDAKNGGQDRTVQELKQDARDIYQSYGKEPPKWIVD